MPTCRGCTSARPWERPWPRCGSRRGRHARIVYFYVVDDEDRLKGVIPAKSLLLSPPEARVDDIMLRHVIAIPAGATVLDACEFFVLHRFLAFPVVDANRRLLGAIDVDSTPTSCTISARAAHRRTTSSS